MEYKNNKLELRCRYYYDELPLQAQYIYRTIYAKWSKGYSEVTFDYPGKTFEMEDGTKLLDIASYVLHENPQLFHIDYRLIKINRLGDKITISVNAIYDVDEYHELYEKLMKKAIALVHMVPDELSHIEKLRFIHDLLARNIVYTYGDGTEKNDREVHSIVGALLHKKCVCDGYSKAFQLISEMCVLPCTMIIGDAGEPGDFGPHAWNLVRYDKNYYHVDVTWDRDKEKGIARDIYFMRRDAFMKRNHSWNETLYHPCKEDYPRKEPTIRGKKELEQFLVEQMKKGVKEIVCELEGKYPEDDKMAKLIREILNTRIANGSKMTFWWNVNPTTKYLNIYFEK